VGECCYGGVRGNCGILRWGEVGSSRESGDHIPLLAKETLKTSRAISIAGPRGKGRTGKRKGPGVKKGGRSLPLRSEGPFLEAGTVGKIWKGRSSKEI